MFPRVLFTQLLHINTQTGQMSTQTRHSTNLNLTSRIRQLRGRMTQQEFSDKVGVSRSALANYETGRSAPNIAVLRDMAKAMDVPETFLTMADELEVESDTRLFGIIADNISDVTSDELTIVRLLRLVDDQSILRLVKLLIFELENNSGSGNIHDYLNIKDDLMTVDKIVKQAGSYDRGSIIAKSRPKGPDDLDQ